MPLSVVRLPVRPNIRGSTTAVYFSYGTESKPQSVLVTIETGRTKQINLRPFTDALRSIKYVWHETAAAGV
jgi:hypothetical protein